MKKYLETGSAFLKVLCTVLIITNTVFVYSTYAMGGHTGGRTGGHVGSSGHTHTSSHSSAHRSSSGHTHTSSHSSAHRSSSGYTHNNHTSSNHTGTHHYGNNHSTTHHFGSGHYSHHPITSHQAISAGTSISKMPPLRINSGFRSTTVSKVNNQLTARENRTIKTWKASPHEPTQRTEKKPLLGQNPKIKKDRTLTDLNPVHDRATAKSIFRNQTKGQNVRQFTNKKGDIIRHADNGIQIRMNPDGSTRLDLPRRGIQSNGETIHFNP